MIVGNAAIVGGPLAQWRDLDFWEYVAAVDAFNDAHKAPDEKKRKGLPPKRPVTKEELLAMTKKLREQHG